jgi:hypothetical protein
VGRGVFDLDQPGDTVHQHSGFTGTSTGQDQLTTHGGSYGLALGIVEGVQQKGEIIAHWSILGCRGTPGKPSFGLTDKKKRRGRPVSHSLQALAGLARTVRRADQAHFVLLFL